MKKWIKMSTARSAHGRGTRKTKKGEKRRYSDSDSVIL